MPARTPEFCDFDCPHADFPPADTAGICRTMSAVWCRQLRELVNKNAPCEWVRRKKDKPQRRKGTQKKGTMKAGRRSTTGRRGH